MLSSSLLRTLGLVIAAVLVAPSAIAQAPPDLPPLSGPPVQPAQPAPPGPPEPSAPQKPATPGKPGPGRYLGPAQAQPMPYAYPYPYYYPQVPAPKQEYNLPPPPPRRRNSAAMMAGGIMLVTGGLTAVITGAVLVSTAVNRIDIYCDSPSFPCAHMDDGPRRTGGALLMAGGALLGAAGIPLWIIGSKMIPIVNGPSQPGTTAPRPAFVPEVRMGAGSASVKFTF